ncbi:uncharacterized protein HfgLR_12865 [Haloferax gibbonsii]|uniref:Uncharacterized protein n=1 Tax=Haloferax gibbonsii TaxID=35746 RepID=A0A871BIW0_HALGI|nr:uncharacterized protein HfgLR_12865 [Haloferax gibbonsii]
MDFRLPLVVTVSTESRCPLFESRYWVVPLSRATTMSERSNMCAEIRN